MVSKKLDDKVFPKKHKWYCPACNRSYPKSETHTIHKYHLDYHRELCPTCKSKLIDICKCRKGVFKIPHNPDGGDWNSQGILEAFCTNPECRCTRIYFKPGCGYKNKYISNNTLKNLLNKIVNMKDLSFDVLDPLYEKCRKYCDNLFDLCVFLQKKFDVDRSFIVDNVSGFYIKK